jgi:hypothetical protein
VNGSAEPTRRECLVALVGGGLASLGGCAEASGARKLAPDRPRCAEGVRVAERRARLRRGTPPEVELAVSNDGEVPVAYELRVVFLQRTSTGFDERAGRDVLAGTVAPGESVTTTATDHSLAAESATAYRLDASLSCEPG